ncbi:sodium:calcium antiporter [uncultured Cytophaga sp.]|uniref:sodium:calcium antiporter n=1 Tax=uncultured Cytophaga sp. TaxID=160238 RepID=UPI0026333CBC|nr:sodium:calcium antiporter [uncultured Cytophaga sp.]
MHSIATPLLILLFLFCSAIIWFAGTKISFAIDIISKHFGIGEAMGGIIFLAIVTNLPEIAITCVAAYNGHMEIAASNILGGIAIQTVVLSVIDVFGVGKSAPLTYRASSVELIIEGLILIFILTLVLMGKFISPNIMAFHITPIEILIFAVWLFGIFILSKKDTLPSFLHAVKDVQEEKPKQAVDSDQETSGSVKPSIIWFSICAVLTLLAGWMLEVSGEELAGRFNMSGVIFGATILAASTSLPEISTGIASAKLKDYRMAMSDIFGGNAFLPCLFLLGSIISGKALISNLQPTDMFLTGLGILLTSIYMIGLIFRRKTQFARMGVDSIAVILVYILGIVGLVYLG